MKTSSLFAIFSIFLPIVVFSQNSSFVNSFKMSINGYAVYWGSGEPATGTIAKIINTDIQCKIGADGRFFLPYKFENGKPVKIAFENTSTQIYTIVEANNYNPIHVKVREKWKIIFPENMKQFVTPKSDYVVVAANKYWLVLPNELNYFGGASAFKRSIWTQKKLDSIGFNNVNEAGVLLKGHLSNDIYLTKNNVYLYKISEKQKYLYFRNKKIDVIPQNAIEITKAQKLIVENATDADLLKNVTFSEEESKSLFYEDGQVFKSGNKYYVSLGGGLFDISSNYSDYIRGKPVITIADNEIKNKLTNNLLPVLVKEGNGNNIFLVTNNEKILVPSKTVDLLFLKDYVNEVPANCLNDFRVSDKKVMDASLIQKSVFDSLQREISYIVYAKAITDYSFVKSNATLNGKRYISTIDEIRKKYNYINLFTPSTLESSPPSSYSSIYPQVTQHQSPTLKGFADLHCHMMAHLGFGGDWMAGTPFGDPIESLKPCSVEGGLASLLVNVSNTIISGSCNTGCAPCAVTALEGPLKWGLGIASAGLTLLWDFACEKTVGDFASCVTKCKAILSPGNWANEIAAEAGFIHGIQGNGDKVGNFIKQAETKGQVAAFLNFLTLGGNHGSEGCCSYASWPRWNMTTSHQSAHIDWVKRAYENGLRLLVMHAVSNKHLCESFNNDDPFRVFKSLDDKCDDMKNCEEQILAMIKLVRDNSSWMTIVTSAQELRDANRDGKLAIVLGIETSDFLDSEKPNVNLEKKKEKLNYLFDSLGVRSAFIIHENDNSLGGAASFGDATRKNGQTPNVVWLQNIKDTKEDARFKEKVNKLGLTEEGQAIIMEMMKLGMMIEIDHLSKLAKDEVLEIAKEQGYAGIVSSHANLYETNRTDEGLTNSSEFSLMDEDIEKITNLGGVIGLITTLRGKDVKNSGYRINDNCSGSTETFSIGYQHLLTVYDRLKIPREQQSIALGTDINGIVLQLGPRFGDDACPLDQTIFKGKQSSKSQLVYPFKSQFNGEETSFMKYGSRTYDFNYTGLSNIGLLPDFIADLNAIGLGEEETAPIFRSVDAYAKMWDKVCSYVDRNTNDPKRKCGSSILVNEEIITIESYSTGEICYEGSGVRGRDFKGAPKIYLALNLVISEDRQKIILGVDCKVTGKSGKPIHNMTEQFTVYESQAGFEIVEILGKQKEIINFYGLNGGTGKPTPWGCKDGPEVKLPSNVKYGLIKNYNIVADTPGDDISDDNNCQCDTRINNIITHPIKIRIRKK